MVLDHELSSSRAPLCRKIELLPTMRLRWSSPALPRSTRQTPASRFPLFAGFLATGVGVALPGALLPVLMTRWHLPDAGGGFLFLLAWIGSSAGALLVGRRLSRALGFGSLAVAAGASGLALLPGRLAFVSMLLFGLGLGLSMTAISLLVQQSADQPDARERSSQALVRLNLLWALGATLCPVLTLGAMRSARPQVVLLPLAAFFCLLALWSLLSVRSRGGSGVQLEAAIKTQGLASRVASLRAFFAATPPALILLVMLTTGVEASTGGWLATYAQRQSDSLAASHVLASMVAAPTCFWAGLLLSRLFWSFAARAAWERWAVSGSLALLTVSASALLLFAPGPLFFTAAALAGFGTGPTYPLLLARALRLHTGGLIFFLAGVGSATLPWLTGVVSTRQSSLHAGFLVPAAGAALMLVLSLWTPAPVLPVSLTTPFGPEPTEENLREKFR